MKEPCNAETVNPSQKALRPNTFHLTGLVEYPGEGLHLAQRYQGTSVRLRTENILRHLDSSRGQNLTIQGEANRERYIIYPRPRTLGLAVAHRSCLAECPGTDCGVAVQASRLARKSCHRTCRWVPSTGAAANSPRAFSRILLGIFLLSALEAVPGASPASLQRACTSRCQAAQSRT